MQEIEDAVQRDVLKRKNKQKNLVGQVHDEVMKNILNKAGEKEIKGDVTAKSSQSMYFQIDKDKRFVTKSEGKIGKNITFHNTLGYSQFLTSIDSSRCSVNQSQQQGTARSPTNEISIIESLSARSAIGKHIIPESRSNTLSPQKKSLVDHKSQISMPGIGLYDVSNKDKFTLKRTTNIILPSRRAAQFNMKRIIIEEQKEKMEKEKVYQFYQKEKEEQKQRFIEHLVPKDEIQIIFPKIGRNSICFNDKFILIEENNRYFQEERTNLTNKERLFMKTLHLKEDFPQEFNHKMNFAKAKARRIKDELVSWGVILKEDSNIKKKMISQKGN